MPATDYNEKIWPASYGGHSRSTVSNAYIPATGHLWDLAAKKGLTYRSYGEYASRSSDGTTMAAAPGVAGLVGHVAPKFKLPGMRDTDNVRAFFAELDEFERNHNSPDPDKRLPNVVIMSLPEDHTAGTRPGDFTPRAMVANADYAVGLLVERITASPYWPETAIFMIEDDAQNGPDHVDARRTIGLMVSPYTKRRFVDSTLYTTSAMLRTIELLLGLPPMTQYDAAAMPMYNSFGTKPDLTPYKAIVPKIDVNEKNTLTAWGARESMEMNLDEVDQAPMFALNQIIWKSVRGPDSEMPLPLLVPRTIELHRRTRHRPRRHVCMTNRANRDTNRSNSALESCTISGESSFGRDGIRRRCPYSIIRDERAVQRLPHSCLISSFAGSGEFGAPASPDDHFLSSFSSGCCTCLKPAGTSNFEASTGAEEKFVSSDVTSISMP
ncbi:MAG TPA: hypothetical protein VFL57_06395 [Bryobacteraceae bacterium]|nr:hypothetical protein [Bryobacteraceae bacterium]